MSQTFRTLLVEGNTKLALDYLIEHPECIDILDQAITYQFDQVDALSCLQDPDSESMEQERVEEYVLEQLLHMEREFKKRCA